MCRRPPPRRLLASTPDERGDMQTYVILRRRGFASMEALGEAGTRSAAEGDRMSEDVRWIRSYVLAEDDGATGTVCIYQATGPEAIREHARRAGLPADEILTVADMVLVRPDPVPAAGTAVAS